MHSWLEHEAVEGVLESRGLPKEAEEHPEALDAVADYIVTKIIRQK
jgi:hypothetical protein